MKILKWRYFRLFFICSVNPNCFIKKMTRITASIQKIIFWILRCLLIVYYLPFLLAACSIQIKTQLNLNRGWLFPKTLYFIYKNKKIQKIIFCILAVILVIIFYEAIGIYTAYKKQPKVSSETKTKKSSILIVWWIYIDMISHKGKETIWFYPISEKISVSAFFTRWCCLASWFFLYGALLSLNMWQNAPSAMPCSSMIPWQKRFYMRKLNGDSLLQRRGLSCWRWAHRTLLLRAYRRKLSFLSHPRWGRLSSFQNTWRTDYYRTRWCFWTRNSRSAHTKACRRYFMGCQIPKKRLPEIFCQPDCLSKQAWNCAYGCPSFE